MVFIPAGVLIWSAFAMCFGVPDGNQRKKVLRIMITIITMFVICHVPKVQSNTSFLTFLRTKIKKYFIGSQN